MLPRFEPQTHDLTQEEKALVPGFVKAFLKYTGPENAVTSEQIIARFHDREIKMTGARVRKIISYIRDEGLVLGLVASSKGYYVSKDPSEIYRWIMSLEGRETKIRMIRKRAEAYLYQLKNNGQSKMEL